MDILEQEKIENNRISSRIVGSLVDDFVRNSAYIDSWEERVNPEEGNFFIALNFHDEYRTEDRAYMRVAEEIADSEFEATIVSEMARSVFVEPSFAEEALKEYQEEND